MSNIKADNNKSSSQQKDINLEEMTTEKILSLMKFGKEDEMRKSEKSTDDDEYFKDLMIKLLNTLD